MRITAGEDVLNGPHDSTVVTADRGPDPIPSSGDTSTQLVDFDDLPPQIQQQVVEMIQKQQLDQQEQTKLGQQQVDDQIKVEQQVQQQTSPVAGDAAPETSHTLVFEMPDGQVQQQEHLQEDKTAEPQQDKPLTLVLQQEQQGGPSGPFVVDTDQLSPEIRNELLKQIYIQGGQPEQLVSEQPQVVAEPQSSEQLINGVAELLTRMAMSDPQGDQSIDLEDIPAEIRSEVIDFVLRTQQLDQVTQQQLEQHKRPSSILSTPVKHSEGLETAAQIGGGLLGGLISGAVGGNYNLFVLVIVQLLNILFCSIGYPGGSYRPPGGSYGNN